MSMALRSTEDRPHWANSAVGDDPNIALAFQSGLTVGLIATKRVKFETCFQDEKLATVVHRNRHNRFDFLPVIDPAKGKKGTYGRIVGLIEIAPFMKTAVSDEQVSAKMRPLSDENLIGADASILAFVRDCDRQECRLILSGLEISGLVSLSDLQQLPVRAALFGLVTYLEILMRNAIRHEFGGTESWIEHLPDRRRKKLQEEINKARASDHLVDTILYTLFPDKATIIRKSPHFSFEKGSFKSDFQQFQFLRNNLAHANNYAACSEAARRVCSTVRLMDKWNTVLLDWLRVRDLPKPNPILKIAAAR